MRIVGMLPCRNEDWILGFSARVALKWVDELVMLDHASTYVSNALTISIAREYSRCVTVVGDENPLWNEMRHRQVMLELARLRGATHLAIIDADEVLSANLVPHIRDMVELTPPQSMLELPLYNLRHGVDKYHQNGLWGQRIVSVAFPDDPQLGWEAYGDVFHHRNPGPMTLRRFAPVVQGQGGIIHFWGSSERRLLAKHRAYKINERLKFPAKAAAEIEREYSMCVKGWKPEEPADWTFADVKPEWYAGYEDLMREHLHVDAEPWQEAWCDEQIKLHGRERFEGLSV